MKKIYVSLLLLIALFAFIFFVVDINFSGNVNNNTEVKKDINYIDKNYLINLSDVPLKYEVKLKNNCFD